MIHVQIFADVEARHAARPRTFEIPPENERHALTIGDFVKVIFVIDRPSPDGPRGERMWLRVVDVLGAGSYVGALDNLPHDFPQYSRGDRFRFDARHVCQILREADQ